MKFKKRVLIEAVIEVDKDFDINELAIGKYYEDSLADAEMILMKQGDADSKEYFRVIDYIKIKELESKEVDDLA